MASVAAEKTHELQTIRWKDITNRFDYYFKPEAQRTLYVSDRGDFVRFHADEYARSTGQAIIEIIKSRGGVWDRGTGWRITDPDTLDAVKARASRSRPAWAIESASRLRFKGTVRIEVLEVVDGWVMMRVERSALNEVARSLPYETADLVWELNRKGSWFIDPVNQNSLISFPMPAEAARIAPNYVEMVEMVSLVAGPDERSAWRSQPVVAMNDTGLVRVTINLTNPLHLIPWGGMARSLKPGHAMGCEFMLTVEKWEEDAQTLAAMGVSIEEKIKNSSCFNLESIDLTSVPGWAQPAPNGYKFFVHQREGIQFLINRGMRALLGDEMGLGKTGTAIGAAIACGAQRVLIVAPANARWVWDREIRGWAGHDSRIFHITESLQDVSGLRDARWVIITYDLLTTRQERFSPPDQITSDWLREQLLAVGHYDALARAEARVIHGKNDDDDDDDRATDNGRAKRLAAAEGKFLEKEEKFTPFHFDHHVDPKIGALLQSLTPPDDREICTKVVKRLNRIGRRMSAEMLNRIQEWGPGLAFIDEAHRIKNSKAGRTQAVRSLIEVRSRGAVLMTGTPLRNHGGEGASLIDALLPGARDRLAQNLATGYWQGARKEARDKAVAEILRTVMVRRLKEEALDLPEKIRQWVDIDPRGDDLAAYNEVMADAARCVGEAIANGATKGEAAKEVMGLLSMARRLLGLAKVVNPAVTDLIDDVVEAKRACLVFAHHRDVIDLLAKQIRARGRSVVVVTGETPAQARAKAEAEFQAGKVDVFLASTLAAGEALTLHRADTCIFVELDWVPAAMLQAEDRGHRAGQKAKGYHIISLLARLSDDGNLDRHVADVLVDKLQNINEILDEHAEISGQRIAGNDASVRSRVVTSLMSDAQHAAAMKNAEKRNASRKTQPA